MNDVIVQRPTPAERLCALLSLAFVTASVVILLLGIARNLGWVLMTLAGLLLVVIGGWYAVSRRSSGRVAAVLIALVGLGLLIAGLVGADLSALRIALVCAFAALSVVGARVALHRLQAQRHNRDRRIARVPAARHPVLIMNPKSGGGKAEKFRLVRECRTRGIEPIVLKPGDDLLELAEVAIARGADVIGMAGGDGSQALVASVASRHEVAHVVVPAGTRNHFALDLGLDRDDVVGALDAFGASLETRVDLATVNDRVFVNNATLGLYAKIVQSPEYRAAKRETAVAMLPDLLGPDAVPLDLRFTGPDGTDYSTAHVILVSNDPYQLRSFGGRGTRERMDLGVLGVVAATISSAMEVGRFAALEAAGQIRRFSGWLEWTATSFKVDSDGPIEIGVDGEALQIAPPLVFKTHPGVLRVRIPLHAEGQSPAAKAIHLASSSTLVELGRLAVGASLTNT